MSADAGTREDVHYEYRRQGEPEVCSRENNGLLSELGRKHLLGSGLGKGYKVRDVTGEAGAVMHLERLSYAQSLRAIGESLQRQGISTFDLEKRGENYSLQVIASQTATGGSFLKKIVQLLGRADNSAREPSDSTVSSRTLCYTPSDISRLVTEQQSRHDGLNVMPDARKLAQVLRVLGDYLDRKEAVAFTVSVSGHSLSVAYETGHGVQQESLTIENLYDRAVQMYLRRSKRLERVN